MRKIVFYIYTRKILEGIVEGNPVMENPMTEFSFRRKSGDFDAYSDEQYQEVYEFVKEASLFWKNKPQEYAAQLLANVFEFAKTTEGVMQAMAARLVENLLREPVEGMEDGSISETHPELYTIYLNCVAKFMKALEKGNPILKNPKIEVNDLLKIGATKNCGNEFFQKLCIYCDKVDKEFWNGKGQDTAAGLLKTAMSWCMMTEHTYNEMIHELVRGYMMQGGGLEVDISNGKDPFFPEKIDSISVYSGKDSEPFRNFISVRENISDIIRIYTGKDSDRYRDFLIEQEKLEDQAYQAYTKTPSERLDRVMSEYRMYEDFLNGMKCIENWSPQEIYRYTKDKIYGQEDAVKSASMLLYNHLRGHKRNILFLGPTGCGKTEIWRVLSGLYKNIRIIDSAKITQEGWKGDYKFQNIFDGMSVTDAEHSIIVLDEFDKMCEPQPGASGCDHGVMIQNELLKLLEGTDLVCTSENGKSKFKVINTSKISFVFCGSFEHMMIGKSEKSRSLGFGANIEKKSVFAQYNGRIFPEDLAAEGNIRREICGRINQIVQLNSMNAEDYERLLDMQSISPIHALEREYELTLDVDRETRKKLTKMAEESKMGVRYIYSALQQMLDDEMFKEDGKQSYKLCMED